MNKVEMQQYDPYTLQGAQSIVKKGNAEIVIAPQAYIKNGSRNMCLIVDKGKFNEDDIKKIINALYLKYGTEKTSAILDKIKDQGYKYSTTSGLTVALSDIKVIPGKEKIIKQAEALNDNIANLYEPFIPD